MSTYRVVSWNVNDEVELEKLQQMAENDEDIRGSVPSLKYSRLDGYNINRGIRMLAGRFLVPITDNIKFFQRIYWQGEFSAGCYPLVFTGINSNWERRPIITTANLGTSIQPDSNGALFAVYISPLLDRNNDDKIDQPFYVDYLAIGY